MQRVVIRAELEGMGVAIGRPTAIAPELREGNAGSPSSRTNAKVRSSWCLITIVPGQEALARPNGVGSRTWDRRSFSGKSGRSLLSYGRLPLI